MKKAFLSIFFGIIVFSLAGCVQNLVKLDNLVPKNEQPIIKEAQKAIDNYMTADDNTLKVLDEKYRTIGGYNENRSIILYNRSSAVLKGEAIIIKTSKKITNIPDLKIKAYITNGSAYDLAYTFSTTSNSIFINNTLEAGNYTLKVSISNIEIGSFNIIVIGDNLTPGIIKIYDTMFEDTTYMFIYGINFGQQGSRVIAKNTATGREQDLLLSSSSASIIVAENSLTFGNYLIKVVCNGKESNLVNVSILKKDDSTPFINEIKASYDMNEPIVIAGANFREGSVVKAVKDTGVVTELRSIFARNKFLIAENFLTSGKYTIKIVNGTVESTGKEIVVTTNVLPIPKIESIPNVKATEAIILNVSNIDTNNATIGLIDPSGSTWKGDVMSVTSNRISISNMYKAGKYIAQIFSNGTTSNQASFSIETAVQKPSPVISSIPPVNEGQDIVIYGTAIDSTSVTVTITNASGVKSSAVVKTRSSDSVTIVNNYPAQIIAVQLFNGLLGSNIFNVAINKMLILAPEITSIPSVNEGTDIVVYATGIDISKVTATIINAYGLKSNAVIKSKTATSVRIANTYSAQNMSIQLFNEAWGSNIVNFTVNKVVKTPVITTISAVNTGTNITITGRNFDTTLLTVKVTNTATSAVSNLAIKSKTSTSIVLTNTLAAGTYTVKVLNSTVESNQMVLTVKSGLKRIE